MSPNEKHIDEYAPFASVYDFFFSLPLRKLRRAICRIAGTDGPKKIIDICCGTGEQVKMLADEGHSVTGIDLSFSMINAGDKHDAALHCMQADATALPFPEKDFDCAILSFALHENSPEFRQSIIKETLRVLKPDGSMVIADYCLRKGFMSHFIGVLIELIERLAGKDHYSGYRHWMAEGAVTAFCEQHDLTIRSRQYFLKRNVLIAECKLDKKNSSKNGKHVKDETKR